MKKLLFASIPFLLIACHTSEDSVSTDGNLNQDSLVVVNDTVSTIIDSLNVDVLIDDDSTRAIIHGSPDQEKLDSIKQAKLEKKEKD